MCHCDITRWVVDYSFEAFCMLAVPILVLAVTILASSRYGGRPAETTSRGLNSPALLCFVFLATGRTLAALLPFPRSLYTCGF
ncbi:hypothetical protein EYF80_018179 [Liparis tanakae]|uniref:Uncharacterized protein n=1 Tax=Liparis tanakae TaxID=230148 RepID=A0A4Z2I2W1_9TELE|nr:hypothetical protein EYF80_018179 [Liparis tanakae]